MTNSPMTHKYPATPHLRAAMEETKFNPYQMGRYLGVPASTLNNWLAERRQMPATAERLLTVLNLMRTLAPGLHEHFLPPPPKIDRRKREFWTAERKAQKRKVRQRTGLI